LPSTSSSPTRPQSQRSKSQGYMRRCPRTDACGREAEKYHDLYFFGVCTLLHRQEGETQKSADVAALPGGGGMPLRRPFN
jgi:hypothetical protein